VAADEIVYKRDRNSVLARILESPRRCRLDSIFEFVKVTLVVKGMKTSSLKQIAANRENAKKSTGPKTPAGKAASSRNALRHGLYSTDLVLPSEDFEEFKAFARRLNEAYAPRDALEEEVVRDIVMVRVRLRRFERVELELYQTYGYYEGENRGEGVAFANDATQGNAFSKLAGSRSLARRELSEAVNNLAQLKARNIPSPPVVGRRAGKEAFVTSGLVSTGDPRNVECVRGALSLDGSITQQPELNPGGSNE